MLNLNCLSCGFLISAEENEESCVCEACGNSWKVAQLTEYRQKVQDVLQKVTQDFERIEKQAEEDRARRKADEERKKQTEDYIARRQADAEVERAKSAGKPQTVIVNGPNIPEIVDNAVSAFVAKNFTSAASGASEVLANDAKNLPAGFIVAFNEQIFNKKMYQLDKFFSNIPSLPGTISSEDLGKLCQLFTAGRIKLAAYEAQILNLVYTNAGESGASEVRKFVDSFSPSIIATRGDGNFLSGELLDTYIKLAAFCSIPQTCFALLSAIETNPASPLKNGEYYLKSKNKKFFDNFVVPVGQVIDNMKSEKNRPQFQQAFADKSRNYRTKAGV